MRSTKMFYLAVAAAVAATALVGAPSAMGEFNTALCTSNASLECAEENLIEEFTLKSGTTVLSTSVATVLCLGSKATAEVESEGLLATASEPLHINVTTLTWEGCGTNAEHNNCEVSNVSLPLFDVLKTGKGLGKATALGAEVHVSCPIVNCYYGGAVVEGFTVEGALHAKGSHHGMFSANELTVPKVKGFLCPAESKWTALYEPPAQSQLCWTSESPCPAEDEVEEFTMSSGAMVLWTSITAVLCLGSEATAENEGSTGATASLKVTELTWEGCGTNAKHNNCEVINQKLPLFDVLETEEGLGEATALGAEVHVSCPLINCYYGGTVEGFTAESALHTKGGGHGMFAADELTVPKIKGILCPEEASWSALYEPSKHLYMTDSGSEHIYLES